MRGFSLVPLLKPDVIRRDHGVTSALTLSHRRAHRVRQIADRTCVQSVPAQTSREFRQPLAVPLHYRRRSIMSFARRLAACVLAVVSMSVLAALVWDQSDTATREAAAGADAAPRTTQQP
jgi:hypothetical protein